jgi:hypothetical protein
MRNLWERQRVAKNLGLNITKKTMMGSTKYKSVKELNNNIRQRRLAKCRAAINKMNK